MCPCSLPGRPQGSCLCGGGGGGDRGAGTPAHLTAARLKAIGDALQARTGPRAAEAAAAMGSRCPSAGTGLATSLALLAALAWLSRRGSA